MDKIFKEAFKKLIKHEGGYSNHKNDYGGETKYGITEKVARNNGYSGNMKNFKLKDAKQIYYNKYWKNYKLDKIKNKWIAMEVFEQGVNMGPGEAIERLQKAYNLLTGGGITEDGIIGPQTLNAVNNYKYPNILYNELNILQGEKYNNNVENDESQRVFLRGWLKRINIIKE